MTASRQTLSSRGVRVERRAEQFRTTYRVDDADGKYLTSLSFREVIAVVAAANGRVRARLYRTYSPWYCDEHMRPQCDDHGIGYGTLSGLQSNHGGPIIEPCGDAEGPLGLTPLGQEILDQINALAGAEVRAA